MSFFSEDTQKGQCDKAYREVDSFFETLYHHTNGYITNISNINFNNLIYREGQNSYALDIK